MSGLYVAYVHTGRMYLLDVGLNMWHVPLFSLLPLPSCSRIYMLWHHLVFFGFPQCHAETLSL
jgi:hypothetical protein